MAVLKNPLLISSGIIIAFLLFCLPYSIISVPVNSTLNATREFSTAYDCQWVTKCVQERDPELPVAMPFVCEKYLEPKYECVLKPTVDITKPPCLIGYVINEKNKCVPIF